MPCLLTKLTLRLSSPFWLCLDFCPQSTNHKWRPTWESIVRTDGFYFGVETELLLFLIYVKHLFILEGGKHSIDFLCIWLVADSSNWWQVAGVVKRDKVCTDEWNTPWCIARTGVASTPFNTCSLIYMDVQLYTSTSKVWWLVYWI